MKAYTDIEQSKKLAEILPLESADMCYMYLGAKDKKYQDFPICAPAMEGDLCAWSLAALLEQFPYELCDDDGNSCYLSMNKEDDVYQLVYEDPYGDFESIETDRYEKFVDACVDMIIRLKELNLL